MWTIYLIDIIENLGCLAFIALLGASLVAILSGITCTDDWKDRTKETRIFKTSSIIVLIAAFFLVFLPAKKTIYLMIGAYAVEHVVETPEAKEFGSKLLKVVNSKLDEMIEKEGSKSKK